MPSSIRARRAPYYHSRRRLRHEPVSRRAFLQVKRYFVVPYRVGGVQRLIRVLIHSRSVVEQERRECVARSTRLIPKLRYVDVADLEIVDPSKSECLYRERIGERAGRHTAGIRTTASRIQIEPRRRYLRRPGPEGQPTRYIA